MDRQHTRRSRLAGLVLLTTALAACSPGAPEPSAAPSRDASSSPSASESLPPSPRPATRPSATPTPTPRQKPSSTGKRTAAAVTRVVAVGDVACAPGEKRTETTCRQRETAEVARRLDPEAVLLLGDLQYENGEAGNFAASFDRSWGALGDRLRPVPGNHEYRTEGAAGYVDYVTGRGLGEPRGYDRFRVGSWTAYAVNSNCDVIDCGPQYRWLRRQLARDTRCSLMYMHHPRYSTGEHGPSPLARRFFALASRSGVEMVLSAHDHDYERFRPMDNRERERPDSGTVQYVSGAGGKSHYVTTGDDPGSEVSIDDEFGVLELELRRDGWSSSFHGVDGDEQDPYSSTCH